MEILPEFGVEMHGGKLQNGADVFLFRRKGMPIYLRAAFFAGSHFDNVSGTAHFLEHMLLAGTEKFPIKNKISEYIQRVGGDFGAATNNAILRFDVEIPESQDIGVGTEVLKEILTKPLLELTTIENERGAILAELRSKKSNPKQYIREVSRRISLQGTSSGRSTLGEETSIQSINKEILTNYKNEFVSSGRVAFIASGDIDIDVLCNNLETINLPVSEKFQITEKLPIIQDKTLDIESYPGLEQLQVALLCRTTIENYKEYCALMAVNEIFGVGRGSRLMAKLRYQSGLVYSASSYVFDYPDWGQLAIHFSCNKADLEKVRAIVIDEFQKLSQISEEELSDTQAKISKGFIRNNQTSESWVDFHENYALFYPNSERTAKDYIETINSLTLEDINEVVEKYKSEENFLMAICGDY
jgi:predicted Zn-dependent peptidase